jgi:hypothetical protein
MQKNIGLTLIVVFLIPFAATNAQTPAPETAATKFDGTYAMVSATKLNETYASTGCYTNTIGQCRDFNRSPLVITSGQVHYRNWTGTVGPQGELSMRRTHAVRDFCQGEPTMVGSIDGAGTARARRTGYWCSYDVVWQKVTK